MGNVAIITVFTDFLTQIAGDSQFGGNVAEAVHQFGWKHRQPDQRFGLLSLDHSTGAQLVWTQGYDGARISFDTESVPPDVERHLVEAVKALGYRVVTPRTKKRGRAA